MKGNFTGWMLLNYNKPVTFHQPSEAMRPTMLLMKTLKHTGVQKPLIKVNGYNLI